MCVRSSIKLIRAFYQVYLQLGFKFLFYPIDWLRMTSFYVLYPADYALSTICVLITLPLVKDVEELTWEVMPGKLRVDLTIFYYIYLPTSVFVFITTFVYLHQKRQEQLQLAAVKMERARAQRVANAKLQAGREQRATYEPLGRESYDK